MGLEFVKLHFSGLLLLMSFSLQVRDSVEFLAVDKTELYILIIYYKPTRQ